MKKALILLCFLLIYSFTYAQKVYSVGYENQVGWKDKSKIHLMYK